MSIRSTIKPITIVLLSLLLLGCSGSKKTTVAPKPNWVNSRPSSVTYYYGIGAAFKTADISQFQQAARQNALADMAAEISVNISSNSVIHAFESNLNFREDFTSTIQAQTQQELEGYELVETWDDVNNYWVFYRLSKSLHQELKEKRKQDAINRSLDFFTDALIARNRGNIRLSLVQMARALEPIKPYFNETLPVTIKDKEVYLGNEIFKEISYTLSHLDVVADKTQITAKVGQPISPKQLTFNVTFNKSTPVADLPLIAKYSEKPMRNNKRLTNGKGAASFDVDIVRTSKSTETFTARVDLADLLQEAGTDPITRRLLNRFNMPEGTIRINIEKPSIHIFSQESEFDKVAPNTLLALSVKNKAIEMGYKVTYTPKDADFIVRINTSTRVTGMAGQYHKVSLEGTISLENNKGSKLYQKSFEDIEFRHFQKEKAGEQAYKEAQRKIEVSYFREIHEAINRM